MKINVIRRNGDRYIVHAESSSDLVYAIKLRILEDEWIALKKQTLIYEGIVLNDWSTLADYGIKDGDSIHLNLPKSRRPVLQRASAALDLQELLEDEEIEAFVLFNPILYLLLLVLGPFRRCLSNSKFQFFLRMVYVLSTFLISHTITKMVFASSYNALFPIWVVFLLKFHGGIDSISVYSLEGNGSANTLYWILIGLLFSVIKLFLKDHTFWLSLSLFSGLAVFKTWERADALNSSSNGALDKETTVIADFMKYEHELSIADFITDEHELVSEGESATMAPYNYLVQFEESNVQFHPVRCLSIFNNTKEVFTVGKIWQCKGQLLKTEEGGLLLKDLCLSLSLFKLLRCRFANNPMPMPEQAKSKLSKLVHMLVSEDDYERTFRVIEVELAFLCDSFYTKYPSIFRRGLPVHKVVELLVTIAGCCIAHFSLRNYQPKDGYLSGITIFGYDVDKLVTGSVILLIAVIEIGQFLLLLCSNWAKVTLICCYVQHYSTFQTYKFLETTLRFICGRQLFKPWERVLGQYSLLESFDHDPNVVLYNSFTSAFMDIPRKGQKESARIKLHDEVKIAVLFCLQLSHIRKLTNGLTSLRDIDQWSVRHGFPRNNLDWACKLESTAHVILVWHIATSVCEIHRLLHRRRKSRDDFIVATSLSKYCAYLVAFCPRLLPDRAHSTECIFDQVVSQAREVLEGCNSMTSRYRKMKALDSGEDIMRRGAKLAKLLIELEEDGDEPWTTLACFWAEMVLFVAITDDATAHAEYLAKGGEFVTHLWALVYHADTAKQDWTEMDV